MTYVPAEWSPHRAMWLGFPSHGELWQEDLTEAQAEVAAFARALAGPGRERVRLLVCGAEAEATADRSRQAAVQYEIGHIVERETGLEAQAVREYLGAYNLDGTFRPPLFALVRVFERRRSFKNLARLYEAELKSATSGEERASALLDRAALVADHLAQPDAAVVERHLVQRLWPEKAQAVDQDHHQQAGDHQDADAQRASREPDPGLAASGGSRRE